MSGVGVAVGIADQEQLEAKACRYDSGEAPGVASKMMSGCSAMTTSPGANERVATTTRPSVPCTSRRVPSMFENGCQGAIRLAII